MNNSLIFSLFMSCFFVIPGAIMATEDMNATTPMGQPARLIDARAGKAAVKKLLAVYETTKNEKILDAIERIVTEQEKQQTLREQNAQETELKQWYCGTGVIGGATITIGWVLLKFIGLFERKRS